MLGMLNPSHLVGPSLLTGPGHLTIHYRHLFPRLSPVHA
mgnify:CR=1 FL=1